jgi:serine/threonine-protein kinase RsbW
MTADRRPPRAGTVRSHGGTMFMPARGPELRLELRVDATPQAVARARREVTRFAVEHAAGAPADIALAVSEAVTNAVQHGYRDGASGQVRIVACKYPDELVIVVRDYGCGMRPNPHSPGAGLGLSIIGAAASEMNVERPEDGGTRIRLRFRRESTRVAA